MADVMEQLPEAKDKSTWQLLNEIGRLYRGNLEMIQTVDKSESEKRSWWSFLEKQAYFTDNFGDLPLRLSHEIGLSSEGLYLSKRSYSTKQHWDPVRTRWIVKYHLIVVRDRFKENID